MLRIVPYPKFHPQMWNFAISISAEANRVGTKQLPSMQKNLYIGYKFYKWTRKLWNEMDIWSSLRQWSLLCLLDGFLRPCVWSLCMGEEWEMKLSSCFPDSWIRFRQICWGEKQGQPVVINLGCILRTVYIGNGNVFNYALMWHTTTLAHFHYLALSFPQTNCTPTKGFRTSQLDEKSHIWKITVA